MQHGPIVDDGLHRDRGDLLVPRSLEDEVFVVLAGARGPRAQPHLVRGSVARGLAVVSTQLVASDRSGAAGAADATHTGSAAHAALAPNTTDAAAAADARAAT